MCFGNRHLWRLGRNVGMEGLIMNREDIIRMAREAGEAEGMAEFVFHPVIERFAALVASAEREACAKIAEKPIGEYEVVVACGTEPAPHRIPQYANWQDIAKAIRVRVREKV